MIKKSLIFVILFFGITLFGCTPATTTTTPALLKTSDFDCQASFSTVSVLEKSILGLSYEEGYASMTMSIIPLKNGQYNNTTVTVYYIAWGSWSTTPVHWDDEYNFEGDSGNGYFTVVIPESGVTMTKTISLYAKSWGSVDRTIHGSCRVDSVSGTLS